MPVALDASAIFGPPVRALDMPLAANASIPVVARECWLYGWSVYVDGSVTMRAQLFNGGDDNSQLVGYIVSDTLEGSTQWFGPQGIYCNSGLYWFALPSVTHHGVLYVAF